MGIVCCTYRITSYSRKWQKERETILDLILTNWEEFVNEVKIGRTLGESDNELKIFQLWETLCETCTLDSRKADFNKFSEVDSTGKWEN